MLGAKWSPAQTDFSVFAPYAERVSVKLFESGADVSFMTAPLILGADGIWTASVEGNLDGQYYLYEVDGRVTADPYALSTNANAQRGMILDMRRTDPDGWANDAFKPKPPVIWEVHIRDFSSDPYLNAEGAGKYSAFKRGVRTPKGMSALVDYIAQLGVTYVHLLPVMDFAIPDENVGAQ